MKLKCLNCTHKFEGTISLDGLGWHGSCPECGGSFDVDVPKGKIIMVFVNDEDPDLDDRHFTDAFNGQNIVTYYAFDTPDEFIKKWRKVSECPDSMWYWVLENGNLVCSGACDPNDIEIYEEYFGKKFEPKEKQCEALEDNLRQCIDRHLSDIFTDYRDAVPCSIVEDVLSDVKECSAYEEGYFSDGDVSLAIQRVLLGRIGHPDWSIYNRGGLENNQ